MTDAAAAPAFADRMMVGATFIRVSLENARISDSHAMGAVFDDCDARRLTFENVNLAGARFHDVNLSDATIESANLTGLTITRATLDGMTINGILVTDLLDAWDARRDEEE